MEHLATVCIRLCIRGFSTMSVSNSSSSGLLYECVSINARARMCVGTCAKICRVYIRM